MQTFFQDKKSDELILLFCGWGMDEKPFLPIESSCDILFVYDYTNLQFDESFDFLKYDKITLVAFSAGVFMAGYLKNMLPKCHFKIAVNGTFDAFNSKLGIAGDVLVEMENLTMETVFEFRKKLIESSAHLELFNKYQPARNLESSMSEFKSLREYAKEGKVVFDYDKVVMGVNDEIIPLANQQRFWQDHSNCSVIDGGHFLFYNFVSFSGLIS